MMQIIPKWKVTVKFADYDVVIWVHDTYIQNVLRKVAELQFTETGLEQPVQIVIGG